MANGQGGPRTPTNPAPVSGPGALSKRTDGRQPARWISGDQYGDGKMNMDLQTSAAMSEAMSTPMSRPSMNVASPTSMDASSLVPLSAPTQRPNEPVTASVPMSAAPARISLADKLYTAMGSDDNSDLDEMTSIAMRFGL